MKTFARRGTINVSVNNTVGGRGRGSSGGVSRAPDVFPPPNGGDGMDCPWISPDCNKRKVATLLSELFGTGVARAYAVKNIGGEDPR